MIRALTVLLAILLLASCSSYNPAVHSSGRVLGPDEANRYFSQGPDRQEECLKFAREQVTDARREKVNGSYTGIFVVKDWKYKGRQNYTVLRQLKCGALQGPIAADGYHTVSRMYITPYTWSRPLEPRHVAMMGDL
jgi:hypothetical protein